MAAVTDLDAVTDPVPTGTQEAGDPPVTRTRGIGLVPSASLITGGALGAAWFWIPLAILVVGITSIPSVIGFILAAVVFIYLMRGVDHVEGCAVKRCSAWASGFRRGGCHRTPASNVGPTSCGSM